MRTVEEALLVEGVGDLGDPLARDELSVLPHDRSLNVGDRVLAVEERHDLKKDSRQEHDRVGVSGGIAEGEDPAALVLDGKGLERTETRSEIGHGWRKLRAAAV